MKGTVGGWALRPVALLMALWIAAAPAWAESEAKTPPGQEPSPEGIVGELFGVPVSANNYYFAKRVADIFPRPWGASDLPSQDREPLIWESLILHYETFQRGLTATEAELDTMVNDLLKGQHLPFTRLGDPGAYRRWVLETLYEDLPLFENQMRFLIQIRKLKDQVLQEQRVSVSEEEMREEFLNEQHHVGGEMVTFETKAEATVFYERVKDPTRWNQMKATGEHKVRPVSLMTLEAYRDLWGISREQLYAFHAMGLGSIGPPMPFGKQWCVYRLLDKRTGDLKEFPKARDSYHAQVEMKKKYEALTRWIEQRKQSARLKVLIAAD